MHGIYTYILISYVPKIYIEPQLTCRSCQHNLQQGTAIILISMFFLCSYVLNSKGPKKTKRNPIQHNVKRHSEGVNTYESTCVYMRKSKNLRKHPFVHLTCYKMNLLCFQTQITLEYVHTRITETTRKQSRNLESSTHAIPHYPLKYLLPKSFQVLKTAPIPEDI